MKLSDEVYVRLKAEILAGNESLKNLLPSLWEHMGKAIRFDDETHTIEYKPVPGEEREDVLDLFRRMELAASVNETA